MSITTIAWELGVSLEEWFLKNPTNNFVVGHIFPVQAGQEQLRGYCVRVKTKNKSWRIVGKGLSLLSAQTSATLVVKKIWGGAHVYRN